LASKYRLRRDLIEEFMTNPQSTLERLLLTGCSAEALSGLLRQVFVTPALNDVAGDEVPRAVLSQALNLLLFRDLLEGGGLCSITVP
jgi:hypothetical protein